MGARAAESGRRPARVRNNWAAGTFRAAMRTAATGDLCHAQICIRRDAGRRMRRDTVERHHHRCSLSGNGLAAGRECGSRRYRAVARVDALVWSRPEVFRAGRASANDGPAAGDPGRARPVVRSNGGARSTPLGRQCPADTAAGSVRGRAAGAFLEAVLLGLLQPTRWPRPGRGARSSRALIAQNKRLQIHNKFPLDVRGRGYRA